MDLLHLSFSLHEDEFPLSGESPLQPGEVLLEKVIKKKFGNFISSSAMLNQ